MGVPLVFMSQPELEATRLCHKRGRPMVEKQDEICVRLTIVMMRLQLEGLNVLNHLSRVKSRYSASADSTRSRSSSTFKRKHQRPAVAIAGGRSMDFLKPTGRHMKGYSLLFLLQRKSADVQACGFDVQVRHDFVVRCSALFYK